LAFFFAFIFLRAVGSTVTKRRRGTVAATEKAENTHEAEKTRTAKV